MSYNFWTFWIVFVVVSFLIWESYAAYTRKQLTLSRYIIEKSKLSWGLLPFILGMLVGGLIVHLFLPWCPDTLLLPRGG
jgi:hypothetical protein